MLPQDVLPVAIITNALLSLIVSFTDNSTDTINTNYNAPQYIPDDDDDDDDDATHYDCNNSPPYDLQVFLFLITHYENNVMNDYTNDFPLYKIPKCIHMKRNNTSIVTCKIIPKPKTSNTNNNPNNTLLDTGDPNKKLYSSH